MLLLAAAYAFTTVAGQPHVRGVADGTASAATFSAVSGVAADPAGNVYVADCNACNIRKITPDGQVSTFAGQNTLIGATATASPYGYADGQGAAARFNTPFGIATDRAGNLYVADSGNGMVRKISPEGLVSTLTRGLDEPDAIAVGPDGAVYITCAENTVDRISPAGAVTVVAGQPGVAGTANGPAAEATFTALVGIAVDPSGAIYVLEGSTSNDIRKIDTNGMVSTWIGTPGSSRQDWDGVGAAAGIAGAGVTPPKGCCLTADAVGNLYVAEGNCVRVIDSNQRITTIAGQPLLGGSADGAGGNARFGSLLGIAVDGAGTLYVADWGNDTISKGTPVASDSPPILVGIRTTPTLSTIGAGSDFGFTAQGEGSASLGYQWFKDGAAIPGATNPSFTIAAATASDAGTYSVTVSDAAGSFSQPTGFALSVFTPPPTTFVQRHANAAGESLWSIAAGSGKIVAVGTGGIILVSADQGATWTRAASGVTGWLLGVCYAEGQFVAVGDNGVILTSPDGSQWAPAGSSGGSPRLNNVAFGNGVFVAVGEQGTILTSPDGQAWKAVASGVTGWLRGLAFPPGGGFFVAGGQGGALIVSADGTTWGTRPRWSPFAASPTTQDIEAITPTTDAGGYFVPILAGASGQGAALGSEYWPGPELSYMFFAQPSGASGYLRGAASGDGTTYLAGTGGCLLAEPVSDSGPFVAIPTGTNADFNGAAFIGNELFLIGANETILQSQPRPASRLLNVSTLASTSGGEHALTTGFSIAGSGTKSLLIRASGPALSSFGVSQPLAQPVLTLYDSTSAPIGSDTGWSGAPDPGAVAMAGAQVGAFPWATGSADSALLVSLPPGVYSTAVTSSDGSTGNSLLELYDADSANARLVNLSSRAWVTANSPLTAGLVIGGTQPRQVLIRALGPALAQFGIGNPLKQPKIALFPSQTSFDTPVVLPRSGSWSVQTNATEIAVDSAMSGAFPLTPGSADQVVIETLQPGPCTVQVSSADGSSGVAVVEVYDLP